MAAGERKRWERHCRSSIRTANGEASRAKRSHTLHLLSRQQQHRQKQSPKRAHQRPKSKARLQHLLQPRLAAPCFKTRGSVVCVRE